MGEVYRGYDQRLDRPVALKRIKPESADDKQRRRFRREARAVARLSHASIVQVFDWVEDDDGDWIIMELIAGDSLRDLMAEGPLAVERLLRIGRDIASGLETAHAAGVVHRDLKAENVMITGDGSAKILDFGLAKRSYADRNETTLSEDGKILGTVTSMSPEQALGHKVSPRSDLFSLGVLLYEMATGYSPFRGSKPVETLTRICTQLQLSALHRQPSLPKPVSDLIDHLLEKDPAARPPSASWVQAELERLAIALGFTSGQLSAAGRDAADLYLGATESVTPLEAATPGQRTPVQRSATGTQYPLLDQSREFGVEAELETAASSPPDLTVQNTPPTRRLWPAAVGLVLIVGLVIAWLQATYQPPAELSYVAVPPTEIVDPTPDRDLGLAATATRSAVMRGLLGLSGLSVVEPAADANANDASSIAHSVGSDEVLTSRLQCDTRSCQVFLKRIGRDGNILWAHHFSTNVDDHLSLTLTVIEQLRSAYPDRPVRADVPDLQVAAGDYARYLEIERRLQQRQGSEAIEQSMAELRQLQSSSPRFLPAFLLEANTARQRFVEERREQDLELALAAIERAARVGPNDPRVLSVHAVTAMDAGRLDEAQAALDQLQRMEPGNGRFLAMHARLIEKQGKPKEALQEMRRAIERLPSWQNYFDLANMASRQGLVDVARQALEDGLQRAPGNYNGLSRLAMLELLSGSAERAAQLYEQLAESSPGVAELSNLGVAYMLAEQFPASVDVFRRASALAPSNPAVLLNQADAELLSGRGEAASALYQRVLDLIEQDPEPEQLAATRAQALSHLGDSEAAVAAIQDALRAEPDNPQTVYTAALVYSVVGDQASAAYNARRALSLGVEARWFSFPWFDHLEGMPELAPLRQQRSSS